MSPKVLLPAMKSDLVPLLAATADGTLSAQQPPEFSPNAHLCVVYCAKGYPDGYQKGTEIKSLAAAEAAGTIVFHAGTKLDGGRVLANGGRVLGISGEGPTVTAAQAKVYEAVKKIEWDDGFYRSDIGYRAVAREAAA